MNTTTKRYRLLKDAPNAKKDTIVIYDHEYGMYSYSGISGQLPDPMFYKEEVEGNPDWFEEVKDAPFSVAWMEFNIEESKDDMSVRHSFWSSKIPANKILEIKKAIEDIVNGVEAPDIDQLQREAFEAARMYEMRMMPPMSHNGGGAYSGPKYLTYEDYKNSKNS